MVSPVWIHFTLNLSFHLLSSRIFYLILQVKNYSYGYVLLSVNIEHQHFYSYILGGLVAKLPAF